MKYAEAHALVAAFVQNWRRKSYPFLKVETVVCPACAGKLLLTQAAYVNAPNVVSVRCSGSFCVHYTE
jgi:hypothetical protein